MAERDRVNDLVRRFRGGDREAFAEIYRAQHRTVFRFALLMTADEVKAAEVLQDVFVWLVHHADAFDPERGELGSFLVGVARKMLKHRRSEELRWIPLEDLDTAAPVEATTDEDVN